MSFLSKMLSENVNDGITSIEIRLDLENAIFEQDATGEVVRILEDVISRFKHSGIESRPLMDINGNKVGSVLVLDEGSNAGE